MLTKAVREIQALGLAWERVNHLLQLGRKSDKFKLAIMSSVVSLAQLVSPSVALLAKLVFGFGRGGITPAPQSKPYFSSRLGFDID